MAEVAVTCDISLNVHNQFHYNKQFFFESVRIIKITSNTSNV